LRSEAIASDLMITMLDDDQEKTPSCFECERSEMLVVIPNHVRRVFDVRFAFRERGFGLAEA
jgi:hypothetical protein